MASTSSTKSLLGLLSQRKPVALQFQQDRPYDTLASFGPAMATEGANLSNNALGRLMHGQQMDSDQSIADTEAKAEQFKALLGNIDKLPPAVRALAISGNPDLLEALGVGMVPPELRGELMNRIAQFETAVEGAGAAADLGQAYKGAGEVGVFPGIAGFAQLFDSLGADSSKFTQGTPTGQAAAMALSGQTTTTRVAPGPDGRSVTVQETDKRPSNASGTTLPSGSPPPIAVVDGKPVRVIFRDGNAVVQLLDPRTQEVIHEIK